MRGQRRIERELGTRGFEEEGISVSIKSDQSLYPTLFVNEVEIRFE